MNSLKQIRDQLLAVWNRSSKATRVTYVAVAAACLLLIIGVGIWSSRPQLVPLATNLSPTQAAQIIDLLDAEKITNKMNFSGSTVLVPKKDFNRARLLIKDIAGLPASTLDEEPNFPGFIPDPDRSSKRREQQIARTLMRMKAIKHASVTLALPDPTPFVREEKPTTAAVVLELQPNVAFDRKLGASVASTVANSVPGLTPEHVTVFDTNGSMLTSSTQGGGEITEQLEFKRRVEAELTAKARWMLNEVLGEGAAVVSVTADIDFRQTERTDIYYDSDSSVKVQEKTTSNTVDGTPQLAVGSPGTQSNVGRAAGSERKGPFSQKIEENETTFAPAKTEETIKEHGGTIRRLSIAATVDLSATNNGSKENYSKEQIEGLVKDAVGFEDKRGDKITLLVGKIVGATPLVDELENGIPWWREYERLARSLSLGVAALVAFVIGLLVIRKLRPITVVKTGDEERGRRRSDLVDELSSKVREHPEAVSRILATWLNDPGRDDGEVDIDSESEKAGSFTQPRRRAA